MELLSFGLYSAPLFGAPTGFGGHFGSQRKWGGGVGGRGVDKRSFLRRKVTGRNRMVGRTRGRTI